jgi:hypothetical protein
VNFPVQRATELLVWGAVVHLIGDFLLQTEWMAQHKYNLRHPASWVHSGIHGLLLLLVFPPAAALTIGLVHLWIDTRIPVLWWMHVIKRMPPGPEFDRLYFWMDQSFHLLAIAAFAFVVGWATIA